MVLRQPFLAERLHGRSSRSSRADDDAQEASPAPISVESDGQRDRSGRKSRALQRFWRALRKFGAIGELHALPYSNRAPEVPCA